MAKGNCFVGHELIMEGPLAEPMAGARGHAAARSPHTFSFNTGSAYGTADAGTGADALHAHSSHGVLAVALPA